MPENSVLFFKNNNHPNAKRGADFKQEFNFPHERGVAFYFDKTFADTNPIESQYKPGTIYKRMYRPLASGGSFYRAILQEKVTESFVSLHILLKKLEELFETVEPTEANLSAYGHKIREI